MRWVLAKASREALERFARSRTLLALDFDGTLAPIVSDPRRAAMRPATRRLLRRAAHAFPCIVLSGRSRADAARRVRGAPLADVIGNHGMERGRAPASALRRARRWIALLESRLGSTPGVAIEDKGLSLAVHYRKARHKDRVRGQILEAAASLGRVRLVGGKDVVNVLPAGGPHKGLALERARKRLGCDAAVYVGDDETDEDVFSLDHRGRLLAIRVGRSSASSAAYYIRTQDEIDPLLRTFVALRLRARPARRARPTGRV